MPRRCSALLFCLAAAWTARSATALCTAGTTPLRVPEDCALISDAVAAIADGGTIDIAAGTYTFGGAGLDLSGKNRAMTLRARSTGGVTFSGGTTGAVVRIANGASNGKPIVFEGIRFADGLSATANRSGGVTMTNAEATFADCAFEQNRMTEATTGGGALGLYGNSRAFVVRSTFLGNRASNDGGAIYVVKGSTGISSAVWIHGSTFQDNRSGKAGGAIYLRDGKARVTNSLFDSNVADFVAGAIYAYGAWTGSAPFCNFSAASTDLVISRSYFLSNRADDAVFPNKSVDGHTEGGALHAEDCTRMQLFQSLVEQNEANVGGAMSIYRARTDIADTVLRGNRAVYAANGQVPAGGTIAELSSDSRLAGSDYPSAELNVTGSLIEGIANSATAQIGGCLTTNGDLARKKAGGSFNAAWRARLTLSGTALAHCRIAQIDTGSTAVAGGALFASLSNVTLTNVLLANDSGDGGASATAIGGGATVSNQTLASFSNVAFSACTSDGPYPDLRVDATSSTSGSWNVWSATQSSPAGGIVLGVPSRVPSGSSPFPGVAYVAYAWSGSSATLDGNALGSPKNGIVQKIEGTHTLAVSGLSNLNATIAAPISPSSTLDATPSSISAGDPTTLAWTTPSGTFLTSLIDRGVGEKPASGNASVSPLGTASYRRLAVTKEGGSLFERLVTVSGSAPPPPPPGSIFADGFESGSLAAWSIAVP